MRYRIYSEDSLTIEVETLSLTVIGQRKVKTSNNDVIYLGSPIVRIADDHDRTIYSQ